MENVEYLPLGSVVLLKGGVIKLLIIGRGLNARNNGKTFFFDYAAVTYPEGLTGDQLFYFNADNIQKICHTGFSDDDDKVIAASINAYRELHPDLEYGSIETWNQAAEE